MKKYVLIDSWGTWGYDRGRKIINCTVKGHNLLAESNELTDLRLPNFSTEYHEDGTWHHYSVEKRAHVKRMGLA